MTAAELRRRCFGLGCAGLEELDGQFLHPAAKRAFLGLRDAAAAAGFDLRIASAYRSFERQRRIWNDKLSGARPVLDDADRVLDLAELGAFERIERVLRFSALPGASRHHWGTDIDVFDAAAVPAAYRLNLSAAEVADDGPFGAVHRWLDERIGEGASFGFYRPYDRDRGGVAPERWHLSFAPVAVRIAGEFSVAALRRVWREAEGGDDAQVLLGRELLEDRLVDLAERFVMRVAEPPPVVLAAFSGRG